MTLADESVFFGFVLNRDLLPLLIEATEMGWAVRPHNSIHHAITVLHQQVALHLVHRVEYHTHHSERRTTIETENGRDLATKQWPERWQ
jgi:hypothetical protein